MVGRSDLRSCTESVFFVVVVVDNHLISQKLAAILKEGAVVISLQSFVVPDEQISYRNVSPVTHTHRETPSSLNC